MCSGRSPFVILMLFPGFQHCWIFIQGAEGHFLQHFTRFAQPKIRQDPFVRCLVLCAERQK